MKDTTFHKSCPHNSKTARSFIHKENMKKII